VDNKVIEFLKLYKIKLRQKEGRAGYYTKEINKLTLNNLTCDFVTEKGI
jgi:hypothetical protein